MACDTFSCGNALIGSMAAFAFIFEKRVGLAERPRFNRGSPDRQRATAGAINGKRHRDYGQQSNRGQYQVKDGCWLHPIHRSP